MPIDDLEARAKFWGELETHSYGGGSLPFPYKRFENLFLGKKVLEIGPGAGRQFHELFRVAASYSVADISQQVLDKEDYKKVPKHLITSYQMEHVGEFDIVHFWYVVHHVKPSELDEFAQFVSKHVKPGGYVLFNTLNLEQMWGSELLGDGKTTSPHSVDDVVKAFSKYFNITEKEYKTLDCVVLVGVKEK